MSDPIFLKYWYWLIVIYVFYLLPSFEASSDITEHRQYQHQNLFRRLSHDTLEGIVKGELCDNVQILFDRCNPGAPDFDREGDVCANDGEQNEAYCSYGIGNNSCAYCGTISLPNITQAPTVVSTNNSTNLCIGNRNEFKTSFGDCSIYVGSNLQYCPIDADDVTNNIAKDVCSECGECSDNQTEAPTSYYNFTMTPNITQAPTVVSTNNSTNLCIGNRNEFKTSFGDCSIYVGSNLQYCPIDADNVTNNIAKDVCSECGECSDNQTKAPTSYYNFTMAPNITQAPTVVSTNNSTKLCIGVRNEFKTYYGDCSYYVGSTLKYCPIDTDNVTNNTAKDVCSECGKCSDPQSERPSSTEVPTPSPTFVSSCEKDNGKKIEYLGDKYSCKQLNKTRRKYRKRICKRVKRAKKLCPVICKYKN